MKDFSHPPYEDVSWNSFATLSTTDNTGHPPYEDVSWNAPWKVSDIRHSSSSLWGCELKYPRFFRSILFFRHPPYEDVSWNGLGQWTNTGGDVILLMRMWVEMLFPPSSLSSSFVILLMRMWVEIPGILRSTAAVSVILFVRMWVEIARYSWRSFNFSSSSLWGCELKCKSHRS